VWRCARRWSSRLRPSTPTSPESCPAKRLLMKPAARLAMLMYLPTRSLLMRAAKSSGLNSMSSTFEFSLAAM
jgi:hypothetical protein